MALTIDQIKEGNIVKYDDRECRLVGFSEYCEYKKYRLEDIREIRLIGECIKPKVGHTGDPVTQVDFNGNKFKGDNLWNIRNNNNLEFISQSTVSTFTSKSSQPEPQFITGMSFRIKNNAEHLQGYRGKDVKILEYRTYHGNTLGYMVQTDKGFTYESDFEAFEKYSEIYNDTAPIITPKHSTSNYMTIEEYYISPPLPRIKEIMEPIYNTSLPINGSVVMDDPKVIIDYSPFLNSKVPILNTNN